MALTPEQQQIILDFYFRCGSEEDIAHGRDLIAGNPEAARLYDGLEETLTELDSIKYEPCPDNLTELTIARLKLAVSGSKTATSTKSNLEKLLESESNKSKPTGKTSVFLPKFYEILAAAAAIVLFVGVFFPAVSTMRSHSRQVACTTNVQSIGQAIQRFFNDSDNLSNVKLTAGSPWWKIGDQSSQSQSNTRFAWQLVKQDYVKPESFICSGHKGSQVVSRNRQFDQLQDFPCPDNISYSFIIFCDKTASLKNRSGRMVIMSDMNPIFRQIPRTGKSIQLGMNEFERVLLNEQMKKMSSPNHCNKGQNVLFYDGSVEFIRQRVVNGDDIFTLRGVTEYKGTESPCDETDIFLVP